MFDFPSSDPMSSNSVVSFLASHPSTWEKAEKKIVVPESSEGLSYSLLENCGQGGDTEHSRCI